MAAGPFITAQNPARLRTDTHRESNMLDDEQTHTLSINVVSSNATQKQSTRPAGADTHQVSRQFVQYLQAG